MKYTETELLALLRFGEKISFECKKAGLGLPNSIWSSYSAFANTIGGDIILGVEEVKEPDSLFPQFVVEGVANADIGSGFPTILDAWKKENWRKPDLREDIILHQVDLDLWMVSLLPEECTAFMQSHFGSSYGSLSSHQQIILCTAYVEKQVTNSRLQPLLETHSVDVAKDLKILVDNGFLLRNNNGRWTTYEINGSYVKETSEGLSWDQVGTKLGPSKKNIVVLPL